MEELNIQKIEKYDELIENKTRQLANETIAISLMTVAQIAAITFGTSIPLVTLSLSARTLAVIAKSVITKLKLNKLKSDRDKLTTINSEEPIVKNLKEFMGGEIAFTDEGNQWIEEMTEKTR